jgi:tRNA (guanine37-N1)-methyltransferase
MSKAKSTDEPVASTGIAATTTATASPKFTTLPVPLPSSPDVIYAEADFPDISLFEQHTVYPALVIPVRRTAELRRMLSHVVLRRPKMKNVYATPAKDNPDVRILVLDNANLENKGDNNDGDDKDAVFQDPKVMELLESGDVQRAVHTISVQYSDFTVDEILRQLLPKEITEIPSAYEQVGRLAHVNLREQHLPFQFWIGKVLMDMNHPRIRTVVNKLGSIDTKFRTFGMQVIAGYDGDGWSEVSVKEEGCTFDMDFRNVYWNSRLAGEHRRLVKLIQDEAQRSEKKMTVVADLMAGVGPFAVPLTRPPEIGNKLNKKKQKKQKLQKKGSEKQQQQDADSEQPQTQQSKITVYANDLNPFSYKYLALNATKNKCQNLHCSMVDGRAFVHQLQTPKSTSADKSDSNTSDEKGMIEIDHVIMNLPATAPDFLDAFRGFTGKNLPRIHVHCFAPKTSEATDYQDALDRCAVALGCPVERERDDVQIHMVRDVAPNKNMLCVSFTLPAQVRSLPRVSIAQEQEQEQTPSLTKAVEEPAVDEPAVVEPAAKRLKATESSSK